MRKRGDKWYFKYTVEIDGKRVTKEKVGGRTKKDCIIAYNKLIAEIEDGGYTGMKSPLFEAFAQRWLDEQVEPMVKPNTYTRYESALRTHLIPHFQGMRLKSITAPFIQQYATSCKGKMSKATLQNNMAILHKLFKSAMGMYGFVTVNPCDAVTIPRFDDGKEEAHTYTDEQMQAIFEMYPETHHLYLPIMLGYHAGLRVGEALALTWDDVDFKAGTIRIHSTLDKYGEAQATPKTDHSNREVVMGDTLKVALNQARLRQLDDKIAMGSKYWVSSNRVCIFPNGKPLTLNHIRTFNRFTNATFGKGYSFHTLRHTHISLLLDAGCPLDVVSRRAGHASINITASTYAHILEKRKAASVDLINSIM